MKKRIVDIFSEREGDEQQIKAAEDIYYKIVNNFNDVIRVNSLIYRFDKILNEPFCLAFTNNDGGTGIGQITYRESTGKHVSCSGIVFDRKTDPEVDDYIKNDKILDFLIKYKDIIIHELIHKNDNKRIEQNKNTAILSDPEYYNSPKEFNAYYLQMATKYYDLLRTKIKTIEQFNNFFGKTNREFIDFFWYNVNKTHPEIRNNLNDTYKAKWNKRIYQLYDELKSTIKETP